MRFIGLFISVLLLIACSHSEQQHIYKISGPTMGTHYHISWVGQDSQLAQPLKQAVDERLAAINKSMSTYDPTSELSLINQGKAAKDAQGRYPVSSDLAEVLSISLELWHKTNGYFDVTIGPLVNLWGFGPQAKPDHIPAAQEISQQLERIGSQHLQLDHSALALSLASPQYIDLSAVAKGWAVDDIAAVLRAHQLEHFMVEIGGEIYAQGIKPNGQPWRIAIERPEALNHHSALIIELNEQGIATSGNYRNYFEEEGVRYSHTIDPRTGYPIKHNLASVTVVHPSTGYADAWATAITVAGVEEGLALAEANNLAVYLLAGSGQSFTQHYSTKFKQLFPQAEGAH